MLTVSKELNLKELEFDIIVESIKEYLEGYLFKNSEINLQFDLSYSQGSGANTYGNIDFMDIINLYNNYKNMELYFLEYTKGYFESKPLTTEECNKLVELYKKLDDILYTSDIILEYNRRYTYSKAQEIEFYDLNEYELLEQLEEGEILDTDLELIKKFNNFLKETFEDINLDIYNYLKSIDI